MDVSPDREALFNEVYDQEHVPLLKQVPGMIAVARFRREPLTMIIGGERKTIEIANEPRYTALYEIEGPEVLVSDAWAKAVDQGRWPGQVRPFTSNRRHLMPEYMAENLETKYVGDEIHPDLREGDAYHSVHGSLVVDLNSKKLPGARLKAKDGVTFVQAFTDLKLHDITSGPGDPDIEELDMHQSGAALFGGNSKFLTRKLWGIANEPPFFHHGQFTTIRETILAHCGEALAARKSFQALNAYDQATVIEFLKTLQVLPPGTRTLTLPDHPSPGLPDRKPSRAVGTSRR